MSLRTTVFETASRAIEYEDEVLPLLEEHGAKLLVRGRRVADQDESLPLEIHLIWFPHSTALNAFLADPRRQELLRKHGDVFMLKHSVQIETITYAPPPPIGGEMEKDS